MFYIISLHRRNISPFTVYFPDQLDKASGEEREKMLSLMSALQEPSNDNYTLSTKIDKNELTSIHNSKEGVDRQLVVESKINPDVSLQHEVQSEKVNEQDKTLSLQPLLFCRQHGTARPTHPSAPKNDLVAL